VAAQTVVNKSAMVGKCVIIPWCCKDTNHFRMNSARYANCWFISPADQYPCFPEWESPLPKNQRGQKCDWFVANQSNLEFPHCENL